MLFCEQLPPPFVTRLMTSTEVPVSTWVRVKVRSPTQVWLALTDSARPESWPTSAIVIVSLTVVLSTIGRAGSEQ